MPKNAKKSGSTGNGKGLDDKNQTLLNALEKKIVYFIVKKPAITVSELAREFNIDRRTVEKILERESVKIAIEEFQKDCDAILFDSLNRAAMVIRASLNSTDEKVRTRVATDLLKGLGKFRNYNDTTFVD